jgi:hypothetical protein
MRPTTPPPEEPDAHAREFPDHGPLVARQASRQCAGLNRELVSWQRQVRTRRVVAGDRQPVEIPADGRDELQLRLAP